MRASKLLPLLFSVCLILFFWFIFACKCLLCSKPFHRKKINRLEIVLITLLYYTTYTYTSISRMPFLLYFSSYILRLSCAALFYYESIIFILVGLWHSFSEKTILTRKQKGFVGFWKMTVLKIEELHKKLSVVKSIFIKILGFN